MMGTHLEKVQTWEMEQKMVCGEQWQELVKAENTGPEWYQHGDWVRYEDAIAAASLDDAEGTCIFCAARGLLSVRPSEQDETQKGK